MQVRKALPSVTWWRTPIGLHSNSQNKLGRLPSSSFVFCPPRHSRFVYSLSLSPSAVPMAAVARIDRRDLWKNKARSLQLQLRDRFRVAVDRRLRRQPFFSNNGRFSTTVQRWLKQFRDFRRESLPSSSAFYRKRGIVELSDPNSLFSLCGYCVHGVCSILV